MRETESESAQLLRENLRDPIALLAEPRPLPALPEEVRLLDRCADEDDVVVDEAGRVCEALPGPHDDDPAAAIASPTDDDDRATTPAAESDAASPTTTPVA